MQTNRGREKLHMHGPGVSTLGEIWNPVCGLERTLGIARGHNQSAMQVDKKTEKHI